MELFYAPDISGITYLMNEEESRHCTKVLRIKKGDHLNLTDGKGGLYEAELVSLEGKHCLLNILHSEFDFGKKNYHLHVAISPLKNPDRLEWFVEKAVEIGVDEITPVISDHSERKQINFERIQRIAVAAMKQSNKAFLPRINNLCSFSNLIQLAEVGQLKLIAHCNPGKKKMIPEVLKQYSKIAILIGPEGDFSEEEVEKASNFSWQAISLGNSRLRSETAGIVACCQVQTFFNALEIDFQHKT